MGEVTNSEDDQDKHPKAPPNENHPSGLFRLLTPQ